MQRDTIFFVSLIFFTNKDHSHSKNREQYGISKVSSKALLPNALNLIKFGEIPHHNQQHGRLKYFFYQRQFPLRKHFKYQNKEDSSQQQTS